MSVVKVKSGKKINVVASGARGKAISLKDAKMNARATQAVKAAVAKTEFCKIC